MKNTYKTLILASLISLTANGCSYLNVGKNEFSCPGKPNGVTCANAREIYEATNNGNVPRPVTEEEVEEMAKSGEHVSTVKGVQDDRVVMTDGRSGGTSSNVTYEKDENGKIVGVQERIVDNYVAPALPNKPVPIRTPAVVMRIWIPAWEDEKGDLNYTGLIYTEIEPRRWIVGNDARNANAEFNPLSQHNRLNK